MIVEPFAGPGGWDEGLLELGLRVDVGIEFDRAACETRWAAGHHAIHEDVADLDPGMFVGADGFIASPPCQGFSSAGKGAARELIPEILAAIHRRDWSARPDPDPKVWLIIDLGRWLTTLTPDWFALDQVPSVLPIWHAYELLLRERGYSTWTGVLNAADYGVPQTRERAILMASRAKTVHPPAATHAHDPVDSLFGTLERWVPVVDVYPHLAGGRMGFPRLDDRGDSEDGYRERDWRSTDEPAFALTEKARSWIFDRPATTVQCDSRLWPPGHKVNQDDRDRLGEDVANERYGDRAGTEAIRLSITDALVLQSFRPDYPVQGSKTKQFEQVGNAIPPLLAKHILRALI